MDQLFIYLALAFLIWAIYSAVKWVSNKIKHINSDKKHGKNTFIGLAAFFVCTLVAGTIQGNAEDNNSSDKQASSSAKVSQASSKDTKRKETENVKKSNFKINETVKLNDVKFKVNSVDFSAGSEYYQPDQGKQYVKVNVTITNTGDDNFDYNPYDFKLNDKGNQTDLDENTDADTLSSGTLSKGGTVTGNLVGQAIRGDKLQLLYKGSIFEKDETFSIDLN